MSSRLINSELLCNDIMPIKLSSPPPKPPRRRHSDQSSAVSSGPYVCGKKKHFNGDLSPNVHNNISTSNSGSESLPLNWSTDCLKNRMSDEALTTKEVLNNSLNNSELCSVPTSDKNNLKSNFPFSQCNKILQTTTEGCFKEWFTNADKSYFNLDSSFMYQENNVQDFSSGIIRSENNCFRKVNGIEVHHRRYHSDPLEIISVSSSSDAQNSYCIKHSKYNFFNEKDVLSSEIKIQKEINIKLWQHLCSLQAKIDSLQQLHCSESNLKTPSFSDLMVDVYKAQREKDVALEYRLKSALLLRDSAIQELEHILRILVRNFKNGDTSKTDSSGTNNKIEQFFQEFENMDNPVDLLQKKHVLLAHLYQVKEEKIRKLSDDLKHANEEKRKAVLKIRSLEEEISELKNAKSVMNSDEDIIYEIANQRDSALAKIKSLQSQLLCHCTQSKMGYKDVECIDAISSSCDKCKNPILKINNAKEKWTSEDDSVDLLEAELKNLTDLLTVEIQKRQNAEQACSKLHRMLNFVLEKVNGLNIGVPV